MGEKHVPEILFKQNRYTILKDSSYIYVCRYVTGIYIYM